MRPRLSPEDLAEQRAAIAQLSNRELYQRIEEAEAWERWQTDLGEWLRRWDRRALYLGRMARGG